MALIHGYEYDIFISYAHVDNIAFPGQADGWIEQFYKNLNLMLAKRYGRLDIVKIWWDNRKLDGSVLFDPSIEDGIKKSAIMICLNSPGYIQSKYCQQELNIFYQKAQEEKIGLKIGERSRIVNVLLNNIPFKDWPKELSGTSGFPFHDAKESEDFGDTVDTLSNDFRAQMQNLRDAVWHILTEFPNEPAVPDQPIPVRPDDFTAPQIPGGTSDDIFTIYLGEVADTLRTPRKRIINELQKKGYSVVTGIPPPDEAVAHEKTTIAALENADLAIHLLDEYPGREIIGETSIWYPQKQTQLALQSTKPQMIWVPAETDFSTIEDEKYKLFLEEIEAGKAASKEYEFVRGAKGTVVQEILDFAEQIKTKQMQKVVNSGKLSVLVDTHFSDQLYAMDLGKTLLDNNIQPFINPQEDDPRKNMNLLGDRMSQVKKLIFLYGSVSREWVTERMIAALQLIANNNYPIESIFIYMAPPHKNAADISIIQRLMKVNVVDSSNNSVIDKPLLQKFINDLKTNAA